MTNTRRHRLPALCLALALSTGATLGAGEETGDETLQEILPAATQPRQAISAPLAEPARTIGRDGFARLEALLGEWRGTEQWSGAIQGSAGPVVATYSQTGNGSALVESLGNGTETWMTTVYFVEGEDLQADHYCTHNQPRLRAAGIDATSVSFELAGISNLDAPDEGHVHRIELRTLGADRLSLIFHYLKGTKPSRWSLELERSGGPR